MPHSKSRISVAIACGGTGGHLFPGLAVAAELVARQCAVTLFVSPKDVDQQAVQHAGLDVVTLPAVGLTWSRLGGFLRGSWESFRAARQFFKTQPHQAVLAMGGFTSAPPVLAGRMCGAATFLHESNTIPGRANRWLARVVDQAFVGFPQAASRLQADAVQVTGTPVRAQFESGHPDSARLALGLEPNRPVLLVMGGSQGAVGLNAAVLETLPRLKQALPEVQYLHLTGPSHFEKARSAYQRQDLRAVVRPFLTEMELALAAATVAVSRAGASSIAELAALRVPAILIPYPFAADVHQFHNARALVETGAARMVLQKQAVPELLAAMLTDLFRDDLRRRRIQEALSQWHHPQAAVQIAESILQSCAGFQPAAPLAELRSPKRLTPPSQLASEIVHLKP